MFQLAELEGHNKELEGRNKDLEGHNKELEGRNKDLEGRNKELEGHNKDLEGCNKDLEGHNEQLLKERDKLFRELDKAKKELALANSKAKAEKAKRDAKKVKKQAREKQSDKGATSPEPIEVSTMSQRVLEEDEEIEQERIKQALLQFRKQRQSLQSKEEHISGSGTLSSQGIFKAIAPPVQYAHEQPPPVEYFDEHLPPAEYFHEHPPSSGLADQLNVCSAVDIGPAPVQLNNQLPPPSRPPKPSPNSPTMSPSDSETHQPPYSQQIPPEIPPQAHAYPQTLPVHLRDKRMWLGPGLAPSLCEFIISVLPMLIMFLHDNGHKIAYKCARRFGPNLKDATLFTEGGNKFQEQN